MIALFVLCWWTGCAIAVLVGVVLIVWAIRNIRRELGGRFMLASGITLTAAAIAGALIV